MTPAPAPPGEFQLLTSPGPSAIAIIRVFGPATAGFCARHVRTRHPLAFDGAGQEPAEIGRASPRILRAILLDSDSAPIDDILVTYHPRRGVPEVRLHLHGSPWAVQRGLELLRAEGFIERTGEGLHGPEKPPSAGLPPMLSAACPPEQSDPTPPLWPAPNAIVAEAWERLPAMITLAAARWLAWQARELPCELRRLLDVSPQVAGPRCLEIAAGLSLFERLARPLRVCIAGPPNAGKSTLVNALAGQNISLVSAIAGTTRDWVEAPGEALGFPVVWIDTAGLRVAGDELEAEGIRRTRRLLAESDQVVVVLEVGGRAVDGVERFLSEYADLRPACVVLNKCDLGGPADTVLERLPGSWREVAVFASAVRGDGLDRIACRVVSGSGFEAAALACPSPSAFTARQVHELLVAGRSCDHNIMRYRLLRCIGEGRSG